MSDVNIRELCNRIWQEGFDADNLNDASFSDYILEVYTDYESLQAKLTEAEAELKKYTRGAVDEEIALCTRAIAEENKRLRDALEILKESPPDNESRIYLMGDYKKGFFCGLEDKNIADIYEAGLHGQEEGVESMLEWCQGIASEALGDKE